MDEMMTAGVSSDTDMQAEYQAIRARLDSRHKPYQRASLYMGINMAVFYVGQMILRGDIFITFPGLNFWILVLLCSVHTKLSRAWESRFLKENSEDEKRRKELRERVFSNE